MHRIIEVLAAILHFNLLRREEWRSELAAQACGASTGWLIVVSNEIQKGIFFFQEEDGIRDYKVTGVQTCALPIYYQSGWVGPVTISQTFPDPPLCSISISPTSGQAPMTAPYSVGFTTTASASCPNATYPTGQATTVYFSGTDGTNTSATPISQNVNVMDPYTVSETPPTLLNGVTTGTYTVTITPVNGFTGRVTVTPNSNASGDASSPARATLRAGGRTAAGLNGFVSFSPTSALVPVSGTTSVTFTVTVASEGPPSGTFTIGGTTSTNYTGSGHFSLAIPSSQVSVTTAPTFTVTTSPANLAVWDT